MNPSLRAPAPSSPSLTAIDTTSASGSLPLRRRRLAATLAVHEKDPKWNKFSQSVEKCLVAFEGVNEWADFITFLAKLLKVSSSSDDDFVLARGWRFCWR